MRMTTTKPQPSRSPHHRRWRLTKTTNSPHTQSDVGYSAPVMNRDLRAENRRYQMTITTMFFFKCLDGGGESITTRAIKPGPARRFDAHHSMNDSIQGSNERPTLDKCNSWREMSCFDGEAHDENRAEQMGAQYDLKQTRPAFGSPRPINGGQFDAEPNDG